jgi:hypothetical protein
MSDERFIILPVSIAGALTTSSALNFPVPFAGEVVGVSSVLGTGNTGADLLVNVTVAGTGVWTATADKVTHVAAATAGTVVSKAVASPVAAGTNYNTKAIFPSATPIASFAAGQTVGVKVDQVGSTVAGSDLRVLLIVVKK